MFIALCHRELLLAWNERALLLLSPLVLALACVTCIMAIGDIPALLIPLGPGVLWTLMVLLTLIQAPTLLHNDQAEGIIEDVLLAPFPLVTYLTAKVFGAWLRYGLPFTLSIPLLLLFFHVPLDQVLPFWGKAALASVQLAFVALFIACVSPASNTPRLFGFFLGLPLYLPTLIALTLPLPPTLSWTLLGIATALSLPVCLWMGEKALITHVTE